MSNIKRIDGFDYPMGYEQRKTYDNIWLWMKAAIDELIEENQ